MKNLDNITHQKIIFIAMLIPDEPQGGWEEVDNIDEVQPMVDKLYNEMRSQHPSITQFEVSILYRATGLLENYLLSK